MFGQDPDLFQNPDLVAVIQAGAWLIHDQDGRVLGHCPGDQNQLLLSAGELIELTVGKSLNTQKLHGPPGGFLLFWPRLAEDPKGSCGPHEDHLHDRKLKDPGLGLGNVGHLPGPLAGGQAVKELVVDLDLSLFHWQDTQNQFEKGGFPGSVSSQDTDNPAAPCPERQILQDQTVAITECHPADIQALGHRG